MKKAGMNNNKNKKDKIQLHLNPQIKETNHNPLKNNNKR